jgi:hypothetical protein
MQVRYVSYEKGEGNAKQLEDLQFDKMSEICRPKFIVRHSTVATVEISDRKDLNTLYKFRNFISVNRIFIKDYKVSVSI